MPSYRPGLHATRAIRLFAITCALLLSRPSLSQSQATASKNMDIAVFAGYQTVDPDFGPANNHGIVAGADVTRYFGWLVAPSIELRLNHTTGAYIDEHSYLGGVRIQGNLRRFHPYADFLAGVDGIRFVHPQDPTYVTDRSMIYSYGGGVDIDLIHRFQLKVDYQGQSMSFDRNFSLAPRPLSVALVYRIPFRPHVK